MRRKSVQRETRDLKPAWRPVARDNSQIYSFMSLWPQNSMIDQSESSILESRVMTPDSQVSEIQNSSFSRTGSGVVLHKPARWSHFSAKNRILEKYHGKQRSIYKCTFLLKAVALPQWTAKTAQPKERERETASVLRKT